MRPFKRLLSIALGMFLVFAIALVINRVDDSLTAEDSAFIASYLQSERIDAFHDSGDYAAQLAFIRRVQTAVLDSVYIFAPIPMRQRREPRDVILAKNGICYDRSRVIEKILHYAGFETRHVFILSVGNRSPLRALLLPGLRSHAVTEVLTAKGWLVVDSSDPWVSIDKRGNPESISQIETVGITHRITWYQAPPSSIYTEPFVAIHGLYSRHGQFYPPYTERQFPRAAGQFAGVVRTHHKRPQRCALKAEPRRPAPVRKSSVRQQLRTFISVNAYV